MSSSGCTDSARVLTDRVDALTLAFGALDVRPLAVLGGGDSTACTLSASSCPPSSAAVLASLARTDSESLGGATVVLALLALALTL